MWLVIIGRVFFVLFFFKNCKFIHSFIHSQGCIKTFLEGGAKTGFQNSSWGNAQNMLFETCKGFGQLHKDCLALILLSTLFKRL